MKPAFVEGISKAAGFLDGHFVGNPIVPGAMLLGYAFRYLNEQGYEVVSIKRVKFLRQLEPMVPFEIELELGETLSKLKWVSNENILAEARVLLRRSVD